MFMPRINNQGFRLHGLSRTFAHLIFDPLRQLFDFLGLADYLERQRILIALAHSIFQFAGQNEQLIRIFLKVFLAPFVGQLLLALFHVSLGLGGWRRIGDLR